MATMKVKDLGSSKAISDTRRKKAASGKGGEFAQRLKETAGVAKTDGAVEGAPVSAVESILSVQEFNDATDGRSRGLDRQYGERLLDHLEALRLDLLAGVVPKDRLTTLAQTMRAQKRLTDDPRLREIIDEIELRAEVEIAKLTRGI
jgi:hypothetical protein